MQDRKSLQVALTPPTKLRVSVAPGGGVVLVDQHQRALRRVASEAQPLEQARMGALGILAPDHHEP